MCDELKGSFLAGLFKGEDNPNVIGVSLTSLDVSAPNPITLNLGGEPLENGVFHLEVLPREILCQLPEGRPLLV